MFSESAELYDAIYSAFKDYGAEAGQIADYLRAAQPDVRSILDIACGTGEHAWRLATVHGFEVDGVDLNPDFVRIAGSKHPAGRFVQADMTDFHLGRRYDAVICMFSSIGYLRTLDNLERALRCFRDHLGDDGIIMIEPWFTPDVMRPGHHSVRSGEVNGICIERVGVLNVEDRISRLHFDYTVEGPDGVRRFSEEHILGLFTVPETMAAFEAAGLEASHDAPSFTGRSLYLARRAS